MSTLGSWIDKDELASVVAQLIPAAGPALQDAEPEPLAEVPASLPEAEIAAVTEAEPSVPEPEISAEAPETLAEAEIVHFDAEAVTLGEEILVEAEIVEVSAETAVEDPTPSAAPEFYEPEVATAEPVAVETESELGSSHSEEPKVPTTEPVMETAATETKPVAISPAQVLEEEEPTPLNFDQPEAYQAAPFPPPDEPAAAGPEVPVSPLRRTAAVQASEALERARDRAEQGGLLKQFGAETPVAEPELPAASSPVILIEPIPDVLPPPEPNFEPSDTATPESPPAEAALEPEADESPGGPSLRERLVGFANRTAEATGSPEVAITDFQSYPLLSGLVSAASPDSALRLAHWFGSLARELKASRDGVSQIALSDGSWLGIVAADSAAGGVCASFRTREPIPAERARQLTEDLRATLQPA